MLQCREECPVFDPPIPPVCGLFSHRLLGAEVSAGVYKKPDTRSVRCVRVCASAAWCVVVPVACARGAVGKEQPARLCVCVSACACAANAKTACVCACACVYGCARCAFLRKVLEVKRGQQTHTHTHGGPQRREVAGVNARIAARGGGVLHTVPSPPLAPPKRITLLLKRNNISVSINACL